MTLRPLITALAAGSVLAATGCNAPDSRTPQFVTRVIHDSPELRSALIGLGWSAAAASATAPVVRFADVAPPQGDEIIIAWERPLDDGGPRAAISVHRLDQGRHTLSGICFDASGDAFYGGIRGAIEVRDVTGDFRDDIVVRRRHGADVVLTIYGTTSDGFGVIGVARGHRVELRDLDGDRRAEVLVSRLVGETIRGFPEILCLAEGGRLTPAVKRYDGVMPDAAKAYIEHLRDATPDPHLRALALRSAASYLRQLGHSSEATMLEREAGFVAPAGEAPTVSKRE